MSFCSTIRTVREPCSMPTAIWIMLPTITAAPWARLLIEGTAGTLVLLGDGSVHHRAFQGRDQTVLLAPDPWEGFGGDCVHHLQTHVIAGILDGSSFENTVGDYLAVIEIEDAVYRSAETGRKIAL